MTDKITSKHPAFANMCRIHRIGYPTTVHHFQKDAKGEYRPVLWNEITPEKSANEREIIVDG